MNKAAICMMEQMLQLLAGLQTPHLHWGQWLRVIWSSIDRKPTGALNLINQPKADIRRRSSYLHGSLEIMSVPLPRRRRGDGGKRTCTLRSKGHIYIRAFEWLDIKINHSNFKIGRQDVSSCQMWSSKYPKTNHTRQNIVQVQYSTLIKVITR